MAPKNNSPKKTKVTKSSSVFHLSRLRPHNSTQGGKRVKATRDNFPKLKGMSLYRLTLYEKGVREPHWHANADELGYCLKGKVLVTFFGTGNARESFVVKAGEAFLIPSGYIHCIENVSNDACELLLEFSHEQPEDFSLSSTLGMFSDAVLGNTWGVSSAIFKKLKRSTQESFAALQAIPRDLSQESLYSSAYHFDLEGSSPLVTLEGGNAKVARKSTWPILRFHSLYSLIIKSSGMREPHWHPQTAEMGYVAQGHARISVLNPDGATDSYELNEGDVYFIPKAYPHHIENLCCRDLHFLIFFDQTMPEDIGFTASVKSFPDEVLGSSMGASPAFFKDLPKYYQDLFIVDKLNRLD